MIKGAENLNLASDFVFGEVMRKSENVIPFLEAVLEKKISGVKYIEKQQDIKDGFNLHGIRLDIALEDTENTQYAVEMQVGQIVDLEKRIRYYSSSIDRRTLEKSESYWDLKPSYVLFICTDDYYGRGLALYKRKSVIEDAEDIIYDDGSHAYILNAEFTVENMSKPALEFLRYINAKRKKLPFDVTQSEYLTQIDRAVEEIKADDRKVERFMTLAAKMEDIRWMARKEGEEKGRAEGLEQGELKTKRETVKTMLERGYPLEEIAAISGMDLEDIRAIAEKGISHSW